MPNLELDHFFIVTDKPEETGDLLLSFGLIERFSGDHEGQGTSNRRFEFSNGMLEILYVRDSGEYENGPARDLRLPERIESREASPFGIILTRSSSTTVDQPFTGWIYKADCFEPPNEFLVGENSGILSEPLCIHLPVVGPLAEREPAGKFGAVSNVQLTVRTGDTSETLRALQGIDRLQIVNGSEHLAVMTLDNGSSGLSKDFRPDLPLIIQW